MREDPFQTVEGLLHIREARGLRVPVAARIFFGLFGLSSAFTAPLPTTTRLLIMGLGIPMVVANAYFLFLLRNPVTNKVKLVGITGVVLDTFTIVWYPFFMYYSFYNSSMPPAVVTHMPVLLAVYMVLIVINSLALRPEYTLVISGAALSVHLGLILFSTNHPLATWSSDPMVTPESGVSLMHVVNWMIFLGIAGGSLVWLTHAARKTVKKAAQLEAERIHIVREQANLLMESRIGALGDLVAGVSHEMNNPLGVVKANAETWRNATSKIRSNFQKCVENGRIDESTEKTLDTLEQTSRGTLEAAGRMASTIKTLRSFARLDEAEFKTIDIHEALDSTLALIPPETVGNTQIRKQYGDLIRIQAYAGRLNQVFITLLTNAFEAVEGAGTITITTKSDKENVTIHIEDTGPGISPEKLKRIFDIQLESKASRVKAGFGMAACQSIVNQHRGNISVRSRINKGSSFIITLPKN